MPENKSGKIFQALEKVWAISALVIVLVLSACFLFLDYLSSDTQNPFELKASVLSLGKNVTTGIIPVFLLFVLSYVIMSQLRALKDDHDHEVLAKKISEKVSNDFQRGNVEIFQHSTSEAELLKRAKKEIYLLQETGSLISETCKSELIAFLKNKGNLKIVLSAPDAQTAYFMALRNANLPATAIMQRLSQFDVHFADIIRQSKATDDQIEIRYSEYPIPETMTIIDPIEVNGEMVIRLSGFQVPFDEKLDLRLTKKTNSDTFEHFSKEFDKIYTASSKSIAITGSPRSGKTSAIERLLNKYPGNENIYYILSKANWDKKGERTGFEVSTSISTKAEVFAVRNADGKYDVNQDIWTQIAAELESALKARKLLVIDEIGPMQLENAKFSQVIDRIVSDKNSHSIFTIAKSREEHTKLGPIMDNPRTVVFDIEKISDIDALLESLEDEVYASTRIKRPEV